MKKTFTTQKNGKKQKRQETDYVNTAYKEQAASLQEPSEEDPIPVLSGEDKTQPKKKPGKNNRFSHFKPIVIAIISATVIGSVLGFVMLRMFVGIDHELTGQSPDSQPVTAVNADGDKQQAEAKPVTIDPINAYVLQGGVFSEQANADEWAGKFKESGMPSLIWEADEQYYLFLGMAEEKEQAKNLIETMKESTEFDVFVKEWSTDEAEVELSDEAQQWFQSFHDQWAKALTNVNNQEALSPTDWEPLVKGYPKDSEQASSLVEAISNMEETTGAEAQITLLNLWQAYEGAIK